ncbi:DNA helicase IV [Nocardioides albertanoniae]|uniref:DNA helicase IV n=1 Tax=Nocardioides albertanoniae TaxID=1175486 RepID=A0A543AB26_9ACTN|nr:UvrD-helicase domain-containing protein [Nocardioides albertanoniae]TQL69775.1 DNA helicase IV [Nocardioides albertanoniae]
MTEETTAPYAGAAVREDAIAEEQAHLDAAHERRHEIVRALGAELSTPAQDAVEQARHRGLARHRTELQRAEGGLVFGRLDALDGTTRRIGRIGVSGATDDDDPLVLDWRAQAARPFYLATPVEPLGQAHRRHIRVEGSTVTGVDDEPLDVANASGLVGEGALFAALGERRTGQMTTAAATLQREQDKVVRAEAKGPLVVQGGPGTGKTVVALHRAAYLLFANPQLAAQGVLTLGPSRRFLDYIAQVLPALGETAIVAATPDILVPGITVTAEDPRATEEIKGRALWQPALTRYVASLTPEATAIELFWQAERYEIPAATVGRLIAAAISGRTYHGARAVFADQVRERLVQAIADRSEELFARVDDGLEDIVHQRVDFPEVAGGDEGSEADGVLTDAELDALREKIADDPHVAVTVGRVWPVLDPEEELRRLLHDDAALRQFAPELSAAERAAVSAQQTGWASGDVALLDAISDLLGDTVVHPPEEEFLAERAAARRDWVYGHVIVDEAQELSEMQWHMVARRTPQLSITAVGDIDQAETPHHHTTWAQAVGAVFGSRWTQAALTIGYRTPAEVMALTAPILKRAGSLSEPPRAVRFSGFEPWELDVDEAHLVTETARAFRELTDRWSGGTVGVIAAADRVPVLSAALENVPVITATQSKGLEWDATLVIDPDGIAAEPRGWNRLYVALTRSTQELGRINIGAAGR